MKWHYPFITIAFVSLSTLLSGGCSGVAQYIYYCKACEQFNIDNIELRTSIDIRNSRDIWCRYNDSTQTKTIVFYMDMDQKDVATYIRLNDLSKIGGGVPTFSTMAIWNDTLKSIPISHLYYKRGCYKKDTWLFVFDSSRVTLWGEIIEKN